MVKKQSKRNRPRKQGKIGRKTHGNRNRNTGAEGRPPRITANTPHDYSTERITAFGGLLGLIKFLDLIDFKPAFESTYTSPIRKPKLGCYRMVLGLLMLLFIGFTRIGHFQYLREDSMVCGILKVSILPAVSTFWRYLQSLRALHSQALLKLMGVLRKSVWSLCGYNPKRISIDLDTTVSTVYGEIEESHKGHNTKHRGKKGLRPVLGFIAETREYISGSQRRGKTITVTEVAELIRGFKDYLPECVKKILVRGDGEFIGWESVKSCEEMGYSFIFGNRRCTPTFKKKGWYRHGEYEYNECLYQPNGWGSPCRFVVMRIPKEKQKDRQLPLFKEEGYSYRVFVTNLKTKPHNAIRRYDKRADVENCIGEAQREGIQAIPSKKFQSNQVFFQLVMLAYNLWRWMKLLSGAQEKEKHGCEETDGFSGIEIVDNTVRIARLKMLYVAAKIVHHGNRNRVYYSIHESRAEGIFEFLDYLDRHRQLKKAE